jgi:hypothetical protein
MAHAQAGSDALVSDTFAELKVRSVSFMLTTGNHPYCPKPGS